MGAVQLTFWPMWDRVEAEAKAKRPTKRVVIPLNECNRRIGQHHHNAWIPDVIVDLIRCGHEDYGWGYKQLCEIFMLRKTTVRKICTYERRAQTPVRYITRRVAIG
jgi:hypothetical protein